LEGTPQTGHRKPGSPLPSSAEILRANKGTASADQVKLYQQKIGSINYAAVITRPDIAFAASRLSEFLLNPAPEHQATADHLIRYLLTTQHLAIEFNADGPAAAGHGHLSCASDAAFGDDPDSRRSSQGYVMKLFNGAVAWKASKQRCVVTSSTEAELVALSYATREYISMARLVKQLQLDLHQQPKILCDNRQTLTLIGTERPQLSSRLKHLDIQALWNRKVTEIN
jgi:hypothetical protein